MPPTKPTYSLPALQNYLTHISLPPTHLTPLLQSLSLPSSSHPFTSPSPSSKQSWAQSTEALAPLHALQKYQQAKIPFTNLYLHYSKFHRGTLDEGELFEYVVRGGGLAGYGDEVLEGGSHGISEGVLSRESRDDIMKGRWGMLVGGLEKGSGEREEVKRWIGRKRSGGRGGTCTINNTFFATVLRSLGMRVRPTCARVALSLSGAGPPGSYPGYNHLVTLAYFDNNAYLIDVGFGAKGITAPLRLRDGEEAEWGAPGLGMGWNRLVRKRLHDFEFLGEGDEYWILQFRKGKGSGEGDDGGKEGEWEDLYCFQEREFLKRDVEVMNFKTAGDVRGSFFNHLVVCVRTVLDNGKKGDGEDGDRGVVGVAALVDGKFKEKIKGKEERAVNMGTEVERWGVLEREFGIVLGESERAGIKGCVTELKGGGFEG